MIAALEAAARALGDHARLATVAVRTAGNSAGSGIRLAPDRVATCAHCIRDPRIEVDVDGRTYRAQLERFDRHADVALLRLLGVARSSVHTTLATRAAATLRPGELVFAFGHPQGSRDVLVHGLVRRADERLVVSDVPLAPGNSGGPLFDAAGALVGMNSAIARERAFSVATETIASIGARRLDAAA